jgi:tRNA dimethylallyltransferase
MSENKIIIVAGPTASGKTSTSISIAKKLAGEIVNFDSLLFYQELNIGTAKPTMEEMSQVPHHLVSTHQVKHPINAADFIKLALPIIHDIHSRGKIVILVGGSGFYLQALLKGMYQSETTSLEVRDKSEKLYTSEGITPFRKFLERNDPISYELYHENDHYRIRRACEHFWMSGTPFSSSREDMPHQTDESPEVLFNWNIFFCYLDLPKDKHLEIITKRTEQMLSTGLVQEVKALLANGHTGDEKPLKSIGYKEVIEYIAGKFTDITACSQRISISTRQLAKAQRTWFKKIEKNEYNSLEDQEKLLSDCSQFAKGI